MQKTGSRLRAELQDPRVGCARTPGYSATPAGGEDVVCEPRVRRAKSRLRAEPQDPRDSRILGYSGWWGAAEMCAAVHQGAPQAPPGLLYHLHNPPPPAHNPDVLLALLARNKTLEGRGGRPVPVAELAALDHCLLRRAGP
ncbi:hypothetical protein J6590_033942 [Homalodisca vitripennis]|nr:hypothetical protein J6590_033942 [Homalodisca vitripennis]